MHITRKMDDPEVMFIEKIDFLVQTISIQIDDEFIGYIYRFTETLDTKIVGVHDLFKPKLFSTDLKLGQSQEEIYSP